MNFKIYVIGDKIEKFYLEGIKEYEKRLSRYCKIQLHYIKNEESLSKKLSDKHYKVFISTKGKIISSEDLADKINHLGVTGQSDVSLIIGADSVPHDEVLSISPMEMDLGLKTTIIFEQIYRAYRILNNEPYHK
ncbi:23S rRNA (pseudouridine(1915)-N(3))-methyltransferase RlmH [Brevibacillus agri]|uniref:23S rRNA (pseudouridine(1915)-N(3))-methyltransferase RlmH n=1 Tax=Brevibacillus TaxID=55080 RepID=UPI002E2185AF|nr:23S rRNA (pseudouridine(1915)-N(3))-methyltransferase RlmH [Brevibacillus agri]MED1643030.1 23S rRNA (pseudouridine(1915)-N(3))-methyltransferase RlmH [Brevibacillus agri]MED1653636.1 23S rRNA (pseudouridine(1915)-N(3))-methyltransferase RlmH [Brevibacillus agri]MED1687287.1 23S rRNA (pseudouridine(1915)-N(3))-methyltransferase RlmH [Brevibacillus agri]MED1693860.1 23S rRNA (pseudouridine(1915)-N(3))-methyltransferase RlmH [Brevibacillus agri]MED1697014.1 23S rRNA (pseudouridine(1915)-N(3))